MHIRVQRICQTILVAHQPVHKAQALAFNFGLNHCENNVKVFHQYTFLTQITLLVIAPRQKELGDKIELRSLQLQALVGTFFQILTFTFQDF